MKSADRKRVPLSLVVIVKNSASSLRRCLESASFVNEILVVDSGSTDETIAIAQECGARVLYQEWLGFGPQKKFAVNQATNDWVLCLDADEYLSDKLQREIFRVFQGEPTHEAYRFARCNLFLGRFLRHGEGYPDWSLRLFNRRSANWTEELVHEKVSGTQGWLDVGTISGDLMHESCESIARYIEKQNNYTSIQASQILASGQSVSKVKILFSPIARFVKYYLLKLGFLDGFPGLVHISIGCFCVFLKYAKASLEKRTKNSSQ